MEILEMNDQWVVCIKPVGMDSERDVPEALSNAVGGPVWAVHRLDKNVGGVMVYARTKAAAAVLSRCVQKGSMVKEYVAMAHGLVPDEDTWTDLLWKDSAKNKVYVVKRLRKGVKEAKLSFWRLNGDDNFSLVRIRLHTGRSHQIRVQFASRKHPLVGDGKYGGKDNSINSPMLFSCCLSFPYDGKIHTFASYPDWMNM